MTQAQLSSTAAATADAANRRSAWTSRAVASVLSGALLLLVGLVFAGAGGTGLWADLTQRSSGYVTTGDHTFSTSGVALATESTQLGSAGVGWLYAPGLLGRVRIHVAPASSASRLFVGIGPSVAVDRYLAGVDHTVISDFFKNKVELSSGGPVRSAPAKKGFWVASAAGRGMQTVTWKPSHGSWTVVVMNADGRPGVAIKATLGARFPAVVWIAIGLLAGAAVFLLAGALLVSTTIRHRKENS